MQPGATKHNGVGGGEIGIWGTNSEPLPPWKPAELTTVNIRSSIIRIIRRLEKEKEKRERIKRKEKKRKNYLLFLG